MADKAAEFWENFERETGEKVAARCLGEFFPEGSADRSEGLWGLLIVTDKALRFKATPSDNMVFGLFKLPEAKGQKAPIDLSIPLSEIAEIEVPKQGFFARLFGSGTQAFTVARGGEEPYRFEADAKSGFLEALDARLRGGNGER
jgi:hypothetical protein